VRTFIITVFTIFTVVYNLNADSINEGQKTIKNPVMIDTGTVNLVDTTSTYTDTQKTVQDTTLTEQVSNKTLTNTKLFIYIVLSTGGTALFFYIFVLSLFRTFHRTRSTRQAIMLSWSIFFTISIIWMFIIWGLIASFWTSSSFMVVIIFLLILSLITAIIALKSK